MENPACIINTVTDELGVLALHTALPWGAGVTTALGGKEFIFS